jgi:ribose transport system ATP-binding protein
MVKVQNVFKTFPGQQALADVNVAFAGGRIHGLVGQNGSGKSTLIKILAGHYVPDEGGKVITHANGVTVEGISAVSGPVMARFVHQGLGLINELDAVENMALEVGYFSSRGGRIDWKRQRKVAAELCERLGLEIDIRVPVGGLSAVERTAVALARALYGAENGQVFLALDEPTAAMTIREIRELFHIVRKLRDQGACILYVSHHLEEVAELVDWVTVLREGKVVADQPVHAFSRTAQRDDLVEAILGSRLTVQRSPQPEHQGGQAASAPASAPVMAVRSIAGRDVRDVTFQVSAGEILGIAGLDGSGRGELAYLLSGHLPLTAGSITMDSESETSLTPARVRELGIALVPADRAINGMVDHFSGRENLTLGRLGVHGLAARLRRGKERAIFLEWGDRLDITPRNPDLGMPLYSGGNQQKIILARALQSSPRLLLLDEPTAGVDIGARATLYELLRSLCADGLGIILCSSDQEELATLAHRVLVFRYGQIEGELAGSDVTEGRIEELILGGTVARA